MFDEPNQSGGLRLLARDIVGDLLLVWAVDYVAHSPTKFYKGDGKPQDVIVVDVVDLDKTDPQNGQCLVARRTWWRNARLIGELRDKIGRPSPMLVRMGTVPSNPGFSDAYSLISMTQDPPCVARAQQWLTQHPDFKPSEAFPQSAPMNPEPQGRGIPTGSAQWGQQSAQPLPPPAPREETVLEKMARQHAENAAARASTFPAQDEKPPW